jgi:probable HAF family extracellular repeat protein
MMSKTVLTSTVLGALLGALACSEPTSPREDSPLQADVATAATTSYTITDIGTLGGNSADARAINNAGQIVGASETASGDTHAFLWTATGGMSDLGTLGGTFSQAFGINNLGHVIGWSEVPSGERRPFLWTPAGGMQDLGTFGGGSGLAMGINDLDQVVGSSDLPDGSMHAFLWTAKQGLTDLVSVVGDNSRAYEISNRQQIVGGSNFSTQANEFCAFTIPFLSDLRGGFQNLGELGTADIDPCGGAFAIATNEKDVVVGFAENDAFLPRAFRWTAESGIVDLGTLTGPDGFSIARAVNARGQIVGQSTAIITAPNAVGGTIDAALWDNAGIHDLGTLPGDFGSRAFGINSAGQIVGLSFGPGLNNHAVLWTPND